MLLFLFTFMWSSHSFISNEMYDDLFLFMRTHSSNMTSPAYQHSIRIKSTIFILMTKSAKTRNKHKPQELSFIPLKCFHKEHTIHCCRDREAQQGISSREWNEEVFTSSWWFLCSLPTRHWVHFTGCLEWITSLSAGTNTITEVIRFDLDDDRVSCI